MQKKKRQKEKRRNNWWFIIAKDGSCEGYWSGETKGEACSAFGVEMKGCSIEKAEWLGREFILSSQSEQGKLF